MDLVRKLLDRSDSWLAPAILAAACVVMGFGGKRLTELARYERAGLAAGEYWRLLTGHLVHLGWEHLAMNVAALLVMAVLFEGVLKTRHWLQSVVVAALAIDAGLYWLDAEVVWYVGLSGVLHGILAAGGLALWRRRAAVGPLILAALLAKLVWEHWRGPVPFSESTAGGPVIVAAHLFGAAGGLVWFGFERAVHALRGRPV